MTDHTEAEVIPFRRNSDDVPDIPPSFGSGHGGEPPLPSAGPGNAGEEDPDDALEGVVLVDQPDSVQPDLRTRFLGNRTAQHRPIIAPWLRDQAEAKETVRWAVAHALHVTAYHAVRVPLYAMRLTLRSPRGAWRVLSAAARWAYDAEGMPLRLEAVTRKDADTYLKLSRQRDDRVRWRRLVTGAGVLGVVLAGASLSQASLLTDVLALVPMVAVLGWIGTPEDKRILDVAVVAPKAQKLTSEIVIRALASLGIAEINKAVGKGGGITFPAPITRDGPGWRADVDLPYGVTATDIMERRDRLASGLRRPMGCVWPEPAHDQHAGRLVLWVGDQDMNQVKPPPWPLANGGKADLFKPVPFGTDQRGRPIVLTLMYANALIAAMPGMGKTFALRILALAAALDLTAELRIFELKGTGDLSFGEKVAHHYGSGRDDETIAACVASLRQVDKLLADRAETVKKLPKDVCPENKVTRQLAARRSLGLFPLVFIVDECQELFTHPIYGSEAAELCIRIIKLGRALGVILLLATQRPDKDSLPTGVSANVGIRFCLKVMGQIENDMVLGTSMYRNGVRATTFSKLDKGIGYLVGEADDPQLARSYYVDNPAADRIADRARAMRKAAGTLSGFALDQTNTMPEAEVSLIEDLAAVFGSEEDKAWSQTLVDRLAELRPSLYGAWAALAPTAKAQQLAAALKPYGISTPQVWGQDETGKGRNLKGVVRDHVREALDRARS